MHLTMYLPCISGEDWAREGGFDDYYCNLMIYNGGFCYPILNLLKHIYNFYWDDKAHDKVLVNVRTFKL